MLAPTPAPKENKPAENAKPVESEESESVYETESSQQPSNFVLGFQK